MTSSHKRIILILISITKNMNKNKIFCKFQIIYKTWKWKNKELTNKIATASKHSDNKPTIDIHQNCHFKTIHKKTSMIFKSHWTIKLLTIYLAGTIGNSEQRASNKTTKPILKSRESKSQISSWDSFKIFK